MAASNVYKILCVSLLFFLGSCSAQNTSEETVEPAPASALHFDDVLDYKGWPDSVDDRSVFMFADYGAWHGYGLPADNKSDYAGSFTGPFLMTQDNGTWISPCLAQLQIRSQKTGDLLDMASGEWLENKATLGALKQKIVFKREKLEVEATLVFVSGRTTFISIDLTNKGKERAWDIGWQGDAFLEGTTFAKDPKNGVRISFAKNQNIGNIMADYRKKVSYDISADQYAINVTGEPIAKGDKWQVNMIQSFCFNEEEWKAEYIKINGAFSNPPYFKAQPQKMMQAKVDKALAQLTPTYQTDEYKRAAVKSITTLNNNWRSKAGNFQYGGLFPSYNYVWFNGFWSWDSWKHAVAIAKYQPEVAKQQIQVMYTYQDDMGMIADCVYRDNVIEADNWRDTKPPLSAWAIWAVYEQMHDTGFLKEILPKLERYHQWWYKYRDHDQNGLCEYGSTDGTLVAAKWESGMDNAVRFDEATLVKNNDKSWSMDRESVDLNAYLYAEKNYMAKLYKAVGQKDVAAKYTAAAEELKRKIQATFYNEDAGWFFDVDLKTKKHLKMYGPEGWTPLWANAATPEQAAQVRKTMLDEKKFATHIPFPTLAADHPKFTPEKGYWRGPIWLDQAYFGVQALKNYGFNEDANKMAKRIIDNTQGFVGATDPIRENYQPLTGKGLKAKHFSWSAAHLLMLMTEE